MRNTGREKNNKKSGSLIGIIVLVIVFLINAAENVAFDVYFLIAFLIIVAVFVTIAVIIYKSLKKILGKNQKPEVMDVVINSRPKVQSSSPKPMYYDSGDMIQIGSQRDRERRLRQLDNFLKNGIIDKDEYNVLKNRYERY